MEKVIERTLRVAGLSANGLRPEHCDALEQACLQNGDVATIATIERARRNWDDAKCTVVELLASGYPVYRNDAPKIV